MTRGCIHVPSPNISVEQPEDSASIVINYGILQFLLHLRSQVGFTISDDHRKGQAHFAHT